MKWCSAGLGAAVPRPHCRAGAGAEELPAVILISDRDTGKGWHCHVPRPHRARGVRGAFTAPGLGPSEQRNLRFIPLCCTEPWYRSQPGSIPSTPTCCPVTGRSNPKKKFGVTVQCWKKPYASPEVVSRRQTWIPLEICPDLKACMEMGVIACTLCLWPNSPSPAVSRLFLTRVRL